MGEKILLRPLHCPLGSEGRMVIVPCQWWTVRRTEKWEERPQPNQLLSPSASLKTSIFQRRAESFRSLSSLSHSYIYLQNPSHNIINQQTNKMQALACSSPPLQSYSLGLGTSKNRLLSRRQLCCDGISSACSHTQSNRTHSPDDAVSPLSISTQRSPFFLSSILLTWAFLFTALW